MFFPFLFSILATGISSVSPVPFSDVSIRDSFWTPRLENHSKVTLNVCIDQIENKTGRIRNFENAASLSGPHSGIFYDDSDVYKALEGMAYSLKNRPDPVLEAKCDEWIAKFAAAQQPDGYLNTYYTLTAPESRWTDMDKHEMYCAGHLIEAAVAYFDATGKRSLLDVAEKFADYMMSVFGPGKRDWVPGHEEIELALVKLCDVTGKREYLDFAGWLLSERGKGLFSAPDWGVGPDYYQDVVPVREMTDISGHAVRAMYLYCGIADVASHTGDTSYLPALDRVWDDVVLRNMYITGGIGSSSSNEGFTKDYDLPNREAYCETCASIGMALWNWRMALLKGDSKYMDICERVIYNGVLAGISAGGDKFFYENPLESDGSHHRNPWYGTACCPSNVCRFIPSIGNYIYGKTDDAIWVNMYIANDACIDGIRVSLESEMPYRGDGISMTLFPEKRTRKEIRLRIPGWCGGDCRISVNGKPARYVEDRGYAVISRNWKKGDTIGIDFRMDAHAVCADPKVKADEGKRAVVRGPLVYCMEEIDNSNIYDCAVIGEDSGFVLNSDGFITDNRGQVFVPYFYWDNRDACRMKVWIDDVN